MAENVFPLLTENRSDCSFETEEEKEHSSDEEVSLNVESSLAYTATVQKKLIKRLPRQQSDCVDEGKFCCSSCSKDVILRSIGTQTDGNIELTTANERQEGTLECEKHSPVNGSRTASAKSSIKSAASNKRPSIPTSALSSLSGESQTTSIPNSRSSIESLENEDHICNGTYVKSRLMLPEIGPPKIITYVGELPPPHFYDPDCDEDPSYHETTMDHRQECQFCGSVTTHVNGGGEGHSREFCCAQFQAFKNSSSAHEQQQFNCIEDELIDTAPHPPYGSKAARKAAKERAAERMREREMERQKGSAAHSNFYSFSRQMKTVQFSLSSAKCMADGWTIRPVSPVLQPLKDRGESFLIDFNASQLQQRGEMNQKFYDSGQQFFVLFEDGTGCCYYPSGNLAIAITSTEEGKFSYIVQENSDSVDYEGSGILALFEANGYAACYYPDGTLRMCLNSYGGVELNANGSRRKRWRWHHIKGHVHTPPFQSSCITLNKYLSVRVSDQDNICLTFSCAKRTVRFNVGARLTALKLNKTNDFALEEEERQLYETKKLISTITNKIQLALRFPKSTIQDKVKSRKLSQKSIKNDQNAILLIN